MAVTSDNNLECLGGHFARENTTHGREIMAQWKYLMNLPGAQTGSYSRNINHLFLMNSAVMMWESKAGEGLNYDEWYMPALKEGETHLTVNFENAEQKIRELKENDDKAKELAKTACSVFEAAFSPCALTKTFANVFELMKTKQKGDGSIEPKELLKQDEYVLVSSGEKRKCMCKGYDKTE